MITGGRSEKSSWCWDRTSRQLKLADLPLTTMRVSDQVMRPVAVLQLGDDQTSFSLRPMADVAFLPWLKLPDANELAHGDGKRRISVDQPQHIRTRVWRSWAMSMFGAIQTVDRSLPGTSLGGIGSASPFGAVIHCPPRRKAKVMLAHQRGRAASCRSGCSTGRERTRR